MRGSVPRTPAPPPASVPPGTGGLRVFLRSGEQASVDYDVPSDEQLSLLCHIPGHIEKGMVGRVDLRDVDLVTIDGADARDFDDAVYCERSGKGWRLLVAIADVGHPRSAEIFCDGADPWCARELIYAGHAPSALIFCRGVEPSCASAHLRGGGAPSALIRCR